jgi:nicotinamide phosphoribosyltransferase
MEFMPAFYVDFYKVGHVDQYPAGIRKIWVNFTPRSSRVEGAKGIIFAGLQMFLKDVFLDQIQENTDLTAASKIRPLPGRKYER